VPVDARSRPQQVRQHLSGKDSGANSRKDCRLASADISGMPPLSEGDSSDRKAVASPTGGKG